MSGNWIDTAARKLATDGPRRRGLGSLLADVKGRIGSGPKAPPAPIARTTSLTTADVPVCRSAQTSTWQIAVDHQLDIVGRDPVGHLIGYWPARRGVFLGNNWYPQAQNKQTFCGTLHHFNYYPGDPDWNNFFIPTAHFAGFLDNPWQVYCADDPDDCDEWPDCGGVPCLEAEHSPDETHNENLFNSKASDRSSVEGEIVCTYGPYVYEEVHDYKPEIHPSELYWWKWKTSAGNPAYMLMLLQDDSNRFDRKGDYGGNPPSWWHPWSEVPRHGVFSLAFEFDNSGPGLPRPSEYWVLIREIQRARPDTADGPTHTLVYNGQVVLRVHEVIPALDDRIKISFTDVCRNSADTRLQGFISLRAAVGEDDRGKEGYLTIQINVFPETEPVIGVQEEMGEWPSPIWEKLMPTPVLIDGREVHGSLRRAEGQPETLLIGDIGVAIVGKPGATREDLTVEKVEFVTEGQRHELPFEYRAQAEALAPHMGVVTGVPVGGVAAQLEFTMQSGAVAHVPTTPVALAPVIVAETPRATSPDASAWSAMVKAAGGDPGDSAAPVKLLRVLQWQLQLAPMYAPMREGRPYLEDESAFSEDLSAAVLGQAPVDDGSERDKGAPGRDLLGSIAPLSVTWEFEAIDLTAGTTVPVAAGGKAADTSIQVELQPGTMQTNGLSVPDSLVMVTFPDRSDALYQLAATATVSDGVGFTGVVKHRVWSHVLAHADSEELVELILPTAATVAGVSADDLVATGALGEPIITEEVSELPPSDAKTLRAELARAVAVGAAEDQRITVKELRSLINAARLFGKAE